MRKKHVGAIMKREVPGSADTIRPLPRINTVSSTISILRKLSDSKRPMGVNAIARSLGLTPSSCFNIMKTLASEGMVDFESDTKLYSISSGFIAIARNALDPEGALDLIRPRLEKLADDWRMTAGFWRLQNNRIILVGYVAGARTMRIQMIVGQRLPSLIGAVGRCIAASTGLGKQELSAHFDELHWELPPTFEEYLAGVRWAGENGWGIDRDHFVKGVTTIATPLPRRDGAIRYCLSATMFSGQHKEVDVAHIAKELQKIAMSTARSVDVMGVESPARDDGMKTLREPRS